MKKLVAVYLIASVVTLPAQFFITGGSGPTRKAKVNKSLPEPPAPGHIWWVSTNGAPGASGSFSDPWSFAYANIPGNARPLDFVAFKNTGQYEHGPTNFSVSYVALGLPEPSDGDPPVNTFMIQVRP